METKIKIKIYAILISIIYCVLTISGIYGGIAGVKAGTNEAQKRIVDKKKFNQFTLNTIPQNGLFTFPQSITNTKTGEQVELEVYSCTIKLEEKSENWSKAVTIFQYVKEICVFLFLVVIIYIPILFFQIVKPIWKNNILNFKLMRRIKRMGWILIGIYFYVLIFNSIGDYFLVTQQLALADYEIIVDFGSFQLLILGLLTLMLGEILSHTLKMKEEQDLTI